MNQRNVKPLIVAVLSWILKETLRNFEALTENPKRLDKNQRVRNVSRQQSSIKFDIY